MNEIQEVAQAVYSKHQNLWPLTWAVADFMAKQLAGDQGETIVANLTHELMQINPVTPVAPVAEATANILVRLDQAYQNLDRLPGDFGTEMDTLNDAELLIRSIHRLMDGREWDSDTTSDIANLLTDQGMVIRPVMDDCDMTAAELAEKYAEPDGGWGEHPCFGRNGWREEVMDGETQRGYWDWVVAQLEQEADG